MASTHSNRSLLSEEGIEVGKGWQIPPGFWELTLFLLKSSSCPQRLLVLKGKATNPVSTVLVTLSFPWLLCSIRHPSFNLDRSQKILQAVVNVLLCLYFSHSIPCMGHPWIKAIIKVSYDMLYFSWGSSVLNPCFFYPPPSFFIFSLTVFHLNFCVFTHFATHGQSSIQMFLIYAIWRLNL